MNIEKFREYSEYYARHKDMCLDEKILWLAMKYGAIKCVYINKSDYFFLFKVPHALVRRNQKNKYKPSKTTGSALKFDSRRCAILHNNKIMIRWEDGVVENYLLKYSKNISESPEFTLNNIFGNKEVKIQSLKYFTPIRDLLRAAGLLNDGRGKTKRVGTIQKKRYEFTIKTFKKIIKKRRKERPWPIKSICDKWAAEELPKYIEKPLDRIKYHYKEITIRRDIEKYMKK